ncbi:MAG: ATP-binding protein [Desulfomonile sp.]
MKPVWPNRGVFPISLDFLGIGATIVAMNRLLSPYIKNDLPEKIVLLSGPRQSGKTTIAKMLVRDFDYFNYDLAEHRVALMEKSWRRDCALVIFDELHKMKNWKSWLKGIYDTSGLKPPMLVTGSARLDTARRTGDSLAGRFFAYRLHPLDLKEVKTLLTSEEAFDRFMRFGGFPEPFLKGQEIFYNRWKKSHHDIILRQDLLDLESVRSIAALETLIELMRRRVGSPVSYNSLAGDLQRDPKTIKRWLELLENMYVIFKVPPYHKNIARSLLKEPKYYFYDTGQVSGDQGNKLENMVACALLKELHFLEDTLGRTCLLNYLRDKEGREIDFLVVIDGRPALMIEVKWTDASLSRNFAIFSKYLSHTPGVQLVGRLDREKSFTSGTRIVKAAPWLTELDLAKYVPALESL